MPANEAGSGKHLSPQEFHDVLSSSDFNGAMKNITGSEKCDFLSDDNPVTDVVNQQNSCKEVVLLDVRNEYETKIGSFQIRDSLGNVISAATDPRTRQVRFRNLLFLHRIV